MGLRINQNIAAMNAYRNLSVNDSSMSKSLEKLSSGFRINRAADDAAGLSISEGLRAQTGGLKVAVRNAQDGISVVQTAEGALTETHSLLQRMRDLAVQASNTGGNDTDARTAIKTEVDQIANEINRIGNATKYGSNNLLDGSNATGFNFQIGSQAGLTNQLSISIGDMRSQTLGLQGTGGTLSSTASTTALAGGVLATDYGNVTVTGPTGTGQTTSKAVTVAAYTGDMTTAAGRALYQENTQKAFDTAFGQGVVRASVALDPLDATKFTVKLETVNTQLGSNISIDASGDASPVGFTAATLATGTAASGLAGATSISDAILAGDTAAITTIDKAISTVSDQRAKLGAYQNRLEHTINNLNVTVENLSASESRIRDTDMASEMVAFTRSQILAQAGTSMLAQANQAPQSVLKLLG
jgi:flagellin